MNQSPVYSLLPAAAHHLLPTGPRMAANEILDTPATPHQRGIYHSVLLLLAIFTAGISTAYLLPSELSRQPFLLATAIIVQASHITPTLAFIELLLALCVTGILVGIFTITIADRHPRSAYFLTAFSTYISGQTFATFAGMSHPGAPYLLLSIPLIVAYIILTKQLASQLLGKTCFAATCFLLALAAINSPTIISTVVFSLLVGLIATGIAATITYIAQHSTPDKPASYPAIVAINVVLIAVLLYLAVTIIEYAVSRKSD